MSALGLKTLLGDYPATEALKKGRIASESVALEFADIRPPSAGFKRVVRGLEFDVAELAITTFLMAKAAGKPYKLLPAVVVGRLQHSFLVHNAARGPLAPRDLAGRRVGVRSYSVTTGMWLRGILADDHGVDCDRITWVTFEEAHVAEFRDPPNVERAAPGKDVIGMLLAGEIDAAVVGDGKPADARIRPLIPDPEAAARAWRARTGAIQINHMVAVKDSVPDTAAAEVSRLLAASIAAAGNPQMNPCGIEANRRNLEVAIDYVHRQRLIPRRYGVEELLR
jgi:4,5-dihydroxyphthalate decarboxylase